MQLPHFETADDVQRSILESLLQEGNVVNARRMKTVEIHPMGFVLTNPRARCITNEARKWSLPLAIGEFAWHLSASDDVEFIGYYAKQWRNFSEDGKVIRESCYGHKIFGTNEEGISQWSAIVALLSEDPDTRRAVLSLYSSATDFGPFSKDVSCVCTIQFMLRNNKLDAITHMRSNDAILGLSYDLFLVTMLQELLAETLSVELGYYYHFANSMHLYERHFSLAESIIKADYSATYAMPQMTDFAQIPVFLRCEAAIREHTEIPAHTDQLADYWKNFVGVLKAYQLKKDSHNQKLISTPSEYSRFPRTPKCELTP